jgi:hypothetical protein
MQYVELSGGMVIKTENPDRWPNAKRLTKREGALAIKISAAANLHGTLSPGNRVYTVLRHVSASGMSRNIDVYVFRDNRPVYLTGAVANLLDAKRAKDNSIQISGCGTDMGFEIVYRLSRALYPNGSDAEKDGGYVLKHEWL